MSRKRNAEIVHAALPEMGESPVQVQRLAQSLPLTLPQVTAALQVLKHSGRAINPRGTRTNYWTKYEEKAMPEPEPMPEPKEAPQSDAEARVHEVERHLARIEGSLAGMSSRLGEMQMTLDALVRDRKDEVRDSVDQHFALVGVLRALGEDLGSDMDQVLLRALELQEQAKKAARELDDAH